MHRQFPYKARGAKHPQGDPVLRGFRRERQCHTGEEEQRWGGWKARVAVALTLGAGTRSEGQSGVPGSTSGKECVWRSDRSRFKWTN